MCRGDLYTCGGERVVKGLSCTQAVLSEGAELFTGVEGAELHTGGVKFGGCVMHRRCEGAELYTGGGECVV